MGGLLLCRTWFFVGSRRKKRVDPFNNFSILILQSPILLFQLLILLLQLAVLLD
jgi:hypothetical protein